MPTTTSPHGRIDCAHCYCEKICSNVSDERPCTPTTIIIPPGGKYFVDNSQGKNSIYCLVEGAVYIKSYDVQGDLSTVAIFLPGDVFSVSQSVSSISANYIIRALSNVELHRLPMGRYMDYCDDKPEVVLQLLDAVSENVVRLSEMIWAMRGSDASAKVLRFVALATKGVCFDDNGNLCLHITQEQLAITLNTNRSSIVRALSRLKKLGVLEYSYGKITLLDPTLLPEITI